MIADTATADELSPLMDAMRRRMVYASGWPIDTSVDDVKAVFPATQEQGLL